MKHKLFVIHDSKAQAFLQPWFLQTEGMAMRAFADCVNDPENNFGRHPEDYNLFIIGEWDDQTGHATTYPPEALGNGITFITPELGDDLKAATDLVNEMAYGTGPSGTTNDSHRTKPNS